ncbi:hypothetical protein [Terrabacter carboxydivorans]|uniref:PqqD family peptide modification chaperone n=1 Tax=Terrabacter carboxydivorans TaxID=619730 RepID=A0ABN3LH47_9MICO
MRRSTRQGVVRDDDGLLFLRVLGELVAVRFAGPAAREQVRQTWSRCVVPPPVDAAGTVPTIRSTESDLPLTRALAHRLTHDLTDLGIDLLAGRAVLLHAAGLSRPGGEVVALVASSGTGKTTAAAALAAAGFGYVTDETVAVLEDGTVPPFPKPLSVRVPKDGPLPRENPEDPDEKVHVGPDALGLQRCSDELRLTGVLLLDRDPALVGRPWLERLDPLKAATALVGHTSALTRLPRPLHRLAALATCGAGVHRAHYAEARDLEPLLHALLDAPSASPPPALDLWSCDAARMPSGGLGSHREGGLVRAQVADGIRTRDGAVLLVGTDPVTLSPLGLTLWDAARAPTDLAALVAAAVAEHGPHPSARELVAAAVETLLDAGVLVRA